MRRRQRQEEPVGEPEAGAVRSAMEEIEAISTKRDRQRIVRRITVLAMEPGPPGCEKLIGAASMDRVRRQGRRDEDPACRPERPGPRAGRGGSAARPHPERRPFPAGRPTGARRARADRVRPGEPALTARTSSGTGTRGGSPPFDPCPLRLGSGSAATPLGRAGSPTSSRRRAYLRTSSRSPGRWATTTTSRPSSSTAPTSFGGWVCWSRPSRTRSSAVGAPAVRPSIACPAWTTRR
jgi:hypothetical protein